jgi:diaminohydroxyphosphoribosylaminopyrimidine deaminase/5-amino-6-(5-phosphoribosylamino)uracil reductase
MDTLRTYSKNDFMKLAIEQHLQCKLYPRVGAVVAKDGVLLSTGYKGEVGKQHAERVALEKLTEEQRCDATIYTTLEPCVGLHDGQTVSPCTDLIIESGVSAVVIGVLDPNGTIYSQGYRKLLQNNIDVTFFNRKLRDAVEEDTFDFGQVDKLIGSGTRRMPVIQSGIDLTVQFSETDERTIRMRWSTLQYSHCVDLSAGNGAVRVAAGVRNFGDITDPTIFRFPSHFARMKKGDIAIVYPEGSSFFVLVELVEAYENDIKFRWACRNIR